MKRMTQRTFCQASDSIRKAGKSSNLVISDAGKPPYSGSMRLKCSGSLTTDTQLTILRLRRTAIQLPKVTICTPHSLSHLDTGTPPIYWQRSLRTGKYRVGFSSFVE